jgi:NTP pyrophosphatase (non-canonical NTP hydrolase)
MVLEQRQCLAEACDLTENLGAANNAAGRNRPKGTPVMSDATTTIDQLRRLIDAFVAERQWHQFHSPKNLSMALAIEAAELMEHFQWIGVEQSRELRSQPEALRDIGEELADVVAYALALANALNLDVANAVRDKMIKNAQKYPAEEYRGRWGSRDAGKGIE